MPAILVRCSPAALAAARALYASPTSEPTVVEHVAAEIDSHLAKDRAELVKALREALDVLTLVTIRLEGPGYAMLRSDVSQLITELCVLLFRYESEPTTKSTLDRVV